MHLGSGTLREGWVRACAAAWGLALAALLAGPIQRPAPADQIPGAMTALGLDAAGPFREVAALLVLPLLCAWAAAFLVRRLATAGRWALPVSCAALAAAPLLLVVGAGFVDVALLGVAAAGAAVCGRFIDPLVQSDAGSSGERTAAGAVGGIASGDDDHGSRDDRETAATAPVPARGLRLAGCDALLVPTALAGYLVLLDLSRMARLASMARLAPTAPAAPMAPIAAISPVTYLLVDLLAIFGLRLVVSRLCRLPRPGWAFAFAPLALLFELPCRPARWATLVGLLWIALTPLATALLARDATAERRLRKLVAGAVYPLFVAVYPLAVVGVDSPPSLDFFEDGHQLLPASEMLAGKLPYADIVPLHGLLSDGGLELAAMKTGHATAGDLLRVRRAAHCATFAAVYAIGYAATGAAEAGLLAALLAAVLTPGWPLGLRPPLALLALAAAVTACRLRSPRWLAVAGVLVPLAFLASPEFALYSGAVALVAAAAALPRRGRALAVLAGSGAAVAAAILAAFWAMGFAGAFVRTTLVELPAAGPAYVIGPFVAPACLATLATPRLQVGPLCLEAVLWVLVVIATAAAIATRPFAGTRTTGIWHIGMWIAFAGASYAERRHLYAGYATAALLASALVLLARRSGRRAALVPALVVAWLANPLGHLFAVVTPPRLGASTAAGASGEAVQAIAAPRASGARIDPAILESIESVRRFAESRLRPGETWFDFTNNATLYYLLDRRCPVRYQEIPFAESERLQGEVIARLERDRSVRAALVAFPGWTSAIDGIPNDHRAPLVWQYLEAHFSPAFAERGVVFWMRREP